MRIFDYIFYRLYVVYKKHDDPATFSACIILFIMYLMASVTFVTFLNNYIIESRLTSLYLTKNEGLIYMGGFDLLVFVVILYCYRKKRVEHILKKYNKSPLNKTIPMWMIWCSPVATLAICIGVYQLLRLFFI